MKLLKLIILTLLFSQFAFSKTQVDTVSLYSSKMHKTIKNVIITPNDYSKKKQYPVIYLLHGFSGNYASYVRDFPVVKELATKYQMVLVCPDGGYSSWYMDSPIDSTFRYESYIIGDLMPYVEANYTTIRNRSSRAICGLSMGGHGSFYLALRHKDLFAHIGSMSGCVDLRSTSQRKTLTNRIGSFDTHPEEWINRSAITLVDSLKSGEFNIMIDCGNSDFFSEINATLHRKLLTMKVDHDYIERPGAHNGKYWKNAILYQMLFFNECFTRAKK